jgi:hypothetical protein
MINKNKIEIIFLFIQLQMYINKTSILLFVCALGVFYSYFHEMIDNKLLIELIGWIASVLIVASYSLNISGKLPTTSKLYVWANIFGGIFFVINTYFHQAYPSMVVNIVWVVIAIVMLVKKKPTNPSSTKI